MRWKTSIEGSDEIPRGQRCEIAIEKNFEDLDGGSVGLSRDDGKAVLASFQRHLVQQQYSLYILFRRYCQGCGGTRPIKDYSIRTIQTVYGAVTVCRVALNSGHPQFVCHGMTELHRLKIRPWHRRSIGHQSPAWRLVRSALIEATDLSWFMGDRVGPDRLALWASMRLSGVQDDTAALARAGWAVRRLTGGTAPEVDLSAFLDRRDPENLGITTEPFADRAGGWTGLMAQAANMHPITRACMGFHLWSFAGLGQQGDRMEAAVTAARIAASEGKGAVFAPLAMGGAGGLRAGGPPVERLSRWLDGMETACLTAMRHLDDIEAWVARAETEMSPLSGKTPPALRTVLTEWPLVSAPMAELLTGASRAAVQRNLAWMETRGLIREVTGQGRYRMWRATG